MRISIVTISFNQGRFLEQAIQSVFEQGYNDLEYIVVDPGSTDGSRAIIEKYKDRLGGIVFEPDRGPADGLNKGFARATGGVYGYLNADDYLLPGALRRVADCFRRRALDVIIGHSIIVDQFGRIRRYHYSDRFNLTAYAYGQAQLMQASTFFKGSVFTNLGGFNSHNRSSWDGELLVDLALGGVRFATVNELFSAFRVYPKSISGSGTLRALVQKDHERLFAKIMRRDKRSYDDLATAWWRVRKHLLNPRNLVQRLLWGATCGPRRKAAA